jgi:hypothetical protein
LLIAALPALLVSLKNTKPKLLLMVALPAVLALLKVKSPKLRKLGSDEELFTTPVPLTDKLIKFWKK